MHWRWTHRLNDGEMSALSDAAFKSYITWAAKTHSEAMEPIYAAVEQRIISAADPDDWDVQACGSYLNSDWGA